MTICTIRDTIPLVSLKGKKRTIHIVKIRFFPQQNAKIKFGVVGTIRGMTFIELLQVMGDKACLHAVCENNEKNLEKAKEKKRQKYGI